MKREEKIFEIVGNLESTGKYSKIMANTANTGKLLTNKCVKWPKHVLTSDNYPLNEN